ncbi:hypothetical protein BD779DRAFT_1116562 [Infundibulicybe gibba]|nr:hypothetical protein BD779DRAFT_1116562 [Infundibulicybe gibba]
MMLNERVIRMLLLWSIIAVLGPANAGFIDASATKNTGYDFIIVGGGTAGNVVANRLTENPKFKVLVLEGGPSDAGVVDIQVPFLCTHLDTGTPYDWNYTTTVQPGLGNRAIPYPRGHVLEGAAVPTTSCTPAGPQMISTVTPK